MPAIDILEMIGQAKDLPTLPTVAARVLGLTQGDGASVKEVANLIEKDMALSSKVLQVINSPFYGFSRGITSVSEAVSLMGFNQVGTLALGISVIGCFAGDSTYGFDFEAFWKRSVGHAVAAVLAAAQARPEAVHAVFTTALLQDIGACLLVRYIPLMYGRAEGLAGERGVHMVRAEREVLGTDHAEVGALLAERWNLPPDMRIPIRHHHVSEYGVGPEAVARDEALRALVALVNGANLIVEALYEADDGARREALLARAEGLVGLDEAQVGRILDALPEEVERIRSLFGREPEILELAGRSAPQSDYLETCPECGSDVGLKFCGNCGASLARSERPKERRRRKQRILVAEDSAATRTAIGNLLRRMGYEVVIALNGHEAVALARESQPDLILMDIMMPVKDGIEALREIRSDIQLRTTPIVMLTSVTDIRLVTQAIESGANDYIAKPFSVTLLTERVERYVHAR